jgi:hypothetical protein
MALMLCPTCARRFESQTTTAMPFCSERCRLIDLGRWLTEEQRLPIEPEDEKEADLSNQQVY